MRYGLRNIFKRIYVWSTGYSYTNMGRLFLRLFVGVMMLQFGLRQWIWFDQESAIVPSIMGLSPETVLTTLVVIEIVCAIFIMVGFCTRLMVVPPFISMCIAEYYLLSSTREAAYLLTWTAPGYLPVMFLGIYFFILLVGPGKISVDYFLSLHFIHSDNASERELEEV